MSILPCATNSPARSNNASAMTKLIVHRCFLIDPRKLKQNRIAAIAPATINKTGETATVEAMFIQLK